MNTAEPTIDTAPTATAGIGGGKFVGIGIFCFTCLGLALLYPYNALISATDWFEYAMPKANNIAGGLANANFIASLVSNNIKYVYYLILLHPYCVDSPSITYLVSSLTS